MSKKRKNNSLEMSAAIRGEERRIFFENGGTADLWRGKSAVHKSKKDKRRSRTKDRLDAIKDHDK